MAARHLDQVAASAEQDEHGDGEADEARRFGKGKAQEQRTTLAGSGDITASRRLWHHPRTKQRIGSGVIHKGHIYFTETGKKQVTFVNAKTGEKKATASLPGKEVFRASPTGADGRIWCINEDGTVSVLAPEDLKILATIPMGRIAVVDDVIAAKTTRLMEPTAGAAMAFEERAGARIMIVGQAPGRRVHQRLKRRRSLSCRTVRISTRTAASSNSRPVVNAPAPPLPTNATDTLDASAIAAFRC